jgi:hypothetical protein
MPSLKIRGLFNSKFKDSGVLLFRILQIRGFSVPSLKIGARVLAYFSTPVGNFYS